MNQSHAGRDAKSHRAEGAVSFMESKTQGALSLVVIATDLETLHDELYGLMLVRVYTGGFYLDLLANGLLIFSDRTSRYFGSHRQLGDSGSLVSRLAGYWASRRSCSVFMRSDNFFRRSGWVLARFSASPRSFFRL